MPAPRTELSLKDTRAALSYAGELAASRETEGLVAQARTLPGLVGADSIIIGQVTRAATGVTILASDDPPGFLTPAALEAFALWSHQHPLVAEHFLGYAPRAMKLTDLVKGARWRRLEIYNDCYRPVGLDMGEIAAQIRASSREVLCVALQRGEGDFGKRELALLDLLTPHLRAAFARVDAQAASLRRFALLEHGLEEHGQLAILVAAPGRIVDAGPRARAPLRTWFGTGASRLPDAVARWWARERVRPAPAVLDVVRGGRRLRLQLVRGEHEDLVLLTERRNEPLSPAALARRLPISPREAEVLAAIARGATNATIAHELGISTHTVARHVERIYAKLGVGTRAAATAAALGADGRQN